MSDAESDADGPPRRSRRARKSVERLGLANGAKRRRVTINADQTDEEQSESDQLAATEDDGDDDVFRTPGKSKARRKSAKNGGGGATRRKKRAADDEDGDDTDAPAARGGDVLKGEYKISRDNDLFEAIRKPGIATESVVEDWTVLYGESDEKRAKAMADLVTCFIRACGCNDKIDPLEAEDHDGAPGRLEEIQERFRKDGTRAYPLVAKSKALKAFRKSLNEFLVRLVQQTDEAEILYDEHFFETFQSWLVAATSSKLRSIRHTTTVITLEVMTALCDVAVKRNELMQSASRARDAAKAKRGGADAERLKTLDLNVREAHQKKMALERYLKDLTSSVYVNRYRDAEPAIRIECIKANAQWLRKHPDHFLKGNELRYIGWMLTDQNKDARLEATKALQSLYQTTQYLGLVNKFTERFKGRLVEMATSEVEMSVRVAALDVLRLMALHALLDDDQLDEVARLVFHVEGKVRRAVAKFFLWLVKEAYEPQKDELARPPKVPRGSTSAAPAASVALDQRQRRVCLWLKCLVDALIQHGQALDEVLAGGDPETIQEGTSQRARPAPAQFGRKSRIVDAVESLWTEDVAELQDWQTLIDYLTADHTAADLDDLLRLNDEQEAVLLEVLVVCARKTRSTAVATAKKDNDPEAETVVTDLSRGLIKAVPRLFGKFKGDAARVSDVLLLPAVIDLELYLSMRMITAYEGLWDDVIAAFTAHSEPEVLAAALAAMRALQAAASLKATNDSKLIDLEDALLDAFRGALGDKEPATASYDVDELRRLDSTLARIAALVATHDLAARLDEPPDDGSPSALAQISALLDRGRLGYADEAAIMQGALDTVFFEFLWRVHEVLGMPGGATDIDVSPVVEMQSLFVPKIEDLVVGEGSQATDVVKQTAVVRLLDLHALFSGAASQGRSCRLLKLSLDQQQQSRLAGYVEAEIERAIERFGSGAGGKPGKRKKKDRDELDSEPGSDDDQDDELDEAGADGDAVDGDCLVALASFRKVLSAFVRALTLRLVDLRHAAVVLAYYGALDDFYDETARTLISIMRNVGIHGDEGALVAAVMVDALRAASRRVVDGAAAEGSLQLLAKALIPAVVMRGPALSIAGKLADEHIARAHRDLLSHFVSAYGDLAAGDARRARLLLLFKALVTLGTTLSGKDALRLQTHLDDALDAADVLPAAAGKLWEPYRAYVKRLTSVMAKDPSIKSAARKRATANGDDDGVAAKPKRARARPSAGARRRTRGTGGDDDDYGGDAGGAADDQVDDEVDGIDGHDGANGIEEEDDDDDDDVRASILPSQAAARARPASLSPSKRKRSPAPPGGASDDEDDAGEPDLGREPDSPLANGHVNGRGMDLDDDDDAGEPLARHERAGSVESTFSTLSFGRQKRARL